MKLSEKAQASLDRVIEKFKAGDLSPITQAACIKLAGDAPAGRWTFSNRVLALAQCGELDCRGYRQWQESGRQVSAGAEAVYILAPIRVKRARQNQDGDKEEVLLTIGFKSIPVFPASVTEGDSPLPEYAPVELPPLVDAAGRLGVNAVWVPVAPDRLGDCDVDGRRIRLGSHDPAVFFHELAHAAHARLAGRLNGGQHVNQETTAEFTAAVLMDLYGLGDHTGNAWRYIGACAADPLQALVDALGTVEQILQLLAGE